jgi:hypothetical protein
MKKTKSTTKGVDENANVITMSRSLPQNQPNLERVATTPTTKVVSIGM